MPNRREQAQGDQDLGDECVLLCRYLIGAAPTRDIADRYTQAHRRLQGLEPDAVTAFAFRRPRSLPYLDAACALRGTSDPLRKKLLLTTALLETSPQHAQAFTTEPMGRIRYLGTLCGLTLSASIKAAIGLVLLEYVSVSP